jgi:hypothetical protein
MICQRHFGKFYLENIKRQLFFLVKNSQLYPDDEIGRISCIR